MIDEKDIQEALEYFLFDLPVPTMEMADRIITAYREKCAELDNARMDYANCVLTLDEVIADRDMWQKSEKKCNEAYKKLSDDIVKAHDLLWDVMCSGVTDPYPTCDYVEVQIDKETWNAIPAALKKEEVK